MGSPVVRRASRRRFHPTPDQVEQLACTFGCVRYVYDRALAERFRVWLTERRRATHAETDRMLTGWKLESQTAWLATPSRGPWQAIPRDL